MASQLAQKILSGIWAQAYLTAITSSLLVLIVAFESLCTMPYTAVSMGLASGEEKRHHFLG